MDQLQQNWRKTIWGAAALLLLLPLLAMQVTAEVRWDKADFALFALMLALACVACEIALRALRSRTGRIVACAVVALALVTVWAELAVGLFR